MVHYRRNRIVGGTYFFTVTLQDRRATTLVDRADDLRQSFRMTRRERPFEIDAIVVLPDHLHAVWTLPPGDDDYAGRWRSIKSRFTHRLAKGGIGLSCNDKGEYTLWQRRYWEHTIRDETDLVRHVDYIHYNPVKHGWVNQAQEWPCSTFHEYVQRGVYPADWAGGDVSRNMAGYGESESRITLRCIRATLAVVKLRRPGRKVLRRGIKQQLQYLRRNLKHIEGLLDEWPPGTPIPLPHWLLPRYWVLPHLYQQQYEMHRNNVRRCDDRIVSISQPYVRPIVRGKQDTPVEFGAKLSASLTGAGLAHIDALRWNAFNEGSDLEGQVEAYKKRYGHYPEAVLGDPAYGTQANRHYLKQHGIRFAGKPLGRPKKVTDANKEELKSLKAQRQQEYRERIPIEGKFGQGKNGYRLNYIRD